MRYRVLSYSRVLNLKVLPTHSLNILIWSVALATHAACKNFAGLFIVRLILGACEGSITAGFMIGEYYLQYAVYLGIDL